MPTRTARFRSFAFRISVLTRILYTALPEKRTSNTSLLKVSRAPKASTAMMRRGSYSGLVLIASFGERETSRSCVHLLLAVGIRASTCKLAIGSRPLDMSQKFSSPRHLGKEEQSPHESFRCIPAAALKESLKHPSRLQVA